MPPTRRQVLAAAAGLGALAAFGGARRILVAPEPSGTNASVDELAAELHAALVACGRTEACFDYDHPLRQYYNRGLPSNGPWTTFLPFEARQLVVDLVHASLSEQGRRRVLGEQFMRLLGLHATQLLLFGNPSEAPYQIHLSGPHLYLRIGSRGHEGVAFGGPQVWGDQHGDGKVGLPGNVYRDQLALGQAAFSGLPQSMRLAARNAKAPAQTAIDIQGRRGRFDGVPIGEMPAKSRDPFRAFVGSILESYAQPDADHAWSCIEANGGVDAFYAADYDLDQQGGRRAGDGPSQIFRPESPAAVFHWRGEPHHHAFHQIAMADEMETPFAYYPESMVAGRLRAGLIRAGDLYVLENWQNRVAVLEAAGKNLPQALRAEWTAHGEIVSDAAQYKIAVPDYLADHFDELGFTGGKRVREGRLLRDAAIDHLQRNGFAMAA